MDPGPLTDPPRREGGIKVHLRARLTAGLVIAIPIWLTFVVASFVFRLMRDASWWLFAVLLLSPLGQPLLATWGVLPEDLRAQGIAVLPAAVRWGVGGLSILLTISAVYVLGLLTNYVVGRRALHLAESMVDRLPLVKTVYRASKQVLETLAGESERPFQRVVLVPYPNPEVRSIGFVTRESRDAGTGALVYVVFVMTSPNPTTGFVFILPAADAIELDWSIEEAMSVVMSAGMLFPPEVALSRAPPAAETVDRAP